MGKNADITIANLKTLSTNGFFGTIVSLIIVVIYYVLKKKYTILKPYPKPLQKLLIACWVLRIIEICLWLFIWVVSRSDKAPNVSYFQFPESWIILGEKIMMFSLISTAYYQQKYLDVYVVGSLVVYLLEWFNPLTLGVLFEISLQITKSRRKSSTRTTKEV